MKNYMNFLENTIVLYSFLFQLTITLLTLKKFLTTSNKDEEVDILTKEILIFFGMIFSTVLTDWFDVYPVIYFAVFIRFVFFLSKTICCDIKDEELHKFSITFSAIALLIGALFSIQ